MHRHYRSPGFRPRLLAALSLVLLAPALARAEMLQFRNDTTIPIVIQSVSVFKGTVLRDSARLLNPNDKTPAIALPGDKIITILDARAPGRILFRGAVPASADDQMFSIQVDARGPALKIEKQRPRRP